ncbi:19036_t:CDS:1, partial [Funneliformis geosporum]
YSDKQRVSRNFDRALTYADQLSAGEKWVVHFTCCENHIANPLWPTKEELEKGLQVVIVWHDLDFMTVRMVAYLWDEEYKMVHVTEVEEFKWDL